MSNLWGVCVFVCSWKGGMWHVKWVPPPQPHPAGARTPRTGTKTRLIYTPFCPIKAWQHIKNTHFMHDWDIITGIVNEDYKHFVKWGSHLLQSVTLMKKQLMCHPKIYRLKWEIISGLNHLGQFGLWHFCYY